MKKVVPYIEVLKNERSLTPSEVYQEILKDKKSRYSFLLESAEIGEKIARYSFLGNSPEKIIKIKNKKASINGSAKNIRDPVAFLRGVLSQYKPDKKSSPRVIPAFSGGLLGYFSYELTRYYEDIGNSSKDELRENDAEFLLVRDLIVFDHRKNEILIIANMFLGEKASKKEKQREEKRAKKAAEKLKEYVAQAKSAAPNPIVNKKNKSGKKEHELKITSNTTKEKFEEIVEKAKEYIYSGDIFQVVLSQRFSAEINAEPFSVYLALKKLNPSPYMFFLDFNETKLIGSSPEILVKVEKGKVVVRPIAGTRKRGKDIVEDEALARELLNDEKERAEHLMLVDLGRNDVGKVSKFGSVRVTDFFAIEKYSHVQHLVSNVEGAMQGNFDAFDALVAAFPAGTVSGAPKIRAMQIIEELEKARRGIYSGAVGYFSFNGDADLAITIRTIVAHGKKAYVQAGAGIVADSVPEREYYETVNKAKGLLEAIKLAENETIVFPFPPAIPDISAQQAGAAKTLKGLKL